MILFPKQLEQLLLAYVKAESYRGTKREAHGKRPFDLKDLRFFSKGVAELSRQFTSERELLKADYLNQPALRYGYLLYFLPIHYAKAAYLFSLFPQAFWQRDHYRILDLGSGPATASLAFLERVAQRHPRATVEIHLVDQNRNILKDAQALLTAWRSRLPALGPIQIHGHAKAIQHFKFNGHYDLIALHNTLNEMGRVSSLQKAEWLLPNLHRHLHETGLVSIVEPALKKPTRELMALRDHLLEEDLSAADSAAAGGFSVLAPCLHEKICPMLAGTHNDWCHFYLDWQEPEYLKKLDRLIQNENRFLKVSYLILGAKQRYEKFLRRDEHSFRVVSNRMSTRGKTEVALCGAPGRIRVTRLDRDRSKENAALDHIRRGDLISLPEYRSKKYEVDGRLRLSKKEKVLKE